MATPSRLQGSFGMKVSEKSKFRVRNALDRIPKEAKKTASRLAARKGQEMVMKMKGKVPVDKGIMRDSIELKMYAHGLKAMIIAGKRKGGRVSKYVEFGTKRRGFLDAQPFFMPVLQEFGPKMHSAVKRSLSAAIGRAVKRRAAGK